MNDEILDGSVQDLQSIKTNRPTQFALRTNYDSSVKKYLLNFDWIWVRFLLNPIFDCYQARLISPGVFWLITVPLTEIPTIVPKSREVNRKIVILLDSYLFPLSLKRRNCQQLKRIELYDCQLITRAGIRKLKVSACDGNHITGSGCKKYLVPKLWKKE